MTKKATHTPLPAKRGVTKRSSNRTTRPGTVSSGNADEGRLKDRISALPDSLLCCILTLLSVRDAARTTVLSSPWRHILSSPEYQYDTIDDNDMWHGRRRLDTRTHWYQDSNQWQLRSEAITSSLTRHRGPIRRFIVQRTLPLGCTVSEWLDTLSQRGAVEELVLEMPPFPQLLLPHFIFNCSSLRSLSLSNWSWPRIGPNEVPVGYFPAWMLPSLTELTLSWMDMTVRDVEDLLQRCPALLSLSIRYPRQSGTLEIRCKNLLSLTIAENYGFWYALVRIVDAPKLVRLLWWPPSPLHVVFEGTLQEQTPRLHTLGIFQSSTLGVVLEQVKTIALITNVDNFNEVQQAILLLHNFPQLETLHMQMKNGSNSTMSKLISFEEMAGGPVACLENSLKTIVLRVNNLVRQKLAFANFLLRAAKALKSMLVCNKRMAGELLSPESRGAHGAQVVFLENSKCTLELDMSASNIKLADPFMP
ncbi:F-box/LRR-repeat protein At3g03030-like [Phragmites australis]|uniref:F-box/LRR-repeat protein At3g03030-like n=1 Tax=Phragmites australis TaxID=29695 RepID=UPI002D785531|nr:F-box/LRR-repeat protein At3g03030-like [Phragmites australis]